MRHPRLCSAVCLGETNSETTSTWLWKPRLCSCFLPGCLASQVRVVSVLCKLLWHWNFTSVFAGRPCDLGVSGRHTIFLLLPRLLNVQHKMFVCCPWHHWIHFIFFFRLLLPLVTWQVINIVQPGHDANETSSLSMNGFLYGTFPTAPSAFIYASQYSVATTIVSWLSSSLSLLT